MHTRRYIFALDEKAYAYSNFIQVVKSKTAAGFVPNFSSAGQKSVDRTEPAIGANVLLKLYNKFGDRWLVELLFDDLLDWHDWFVAFRVLQPAGLLCLGSNSVEGDSYENPNTMSSARLESGMDNSPSWDGEFFNTTTHQMGL